MKPFTALIGYIGTILLVVGALPISVPTAKAFEPVKDYWFIETLTVGEVELPKGVEVLTSDPSSEPRRPLILKNQTETLLYVMSLRYKDVLVMATPDPDWVARVNGAQEAASYLAAPNRMAFLSIEALTDLDPNLTDRNILTFDPPPEDVTIPAAQNSELLLVYGKQVIEVPFKLAYTLNTNFDNGSGVHKNWLTNVQANASANSAATQQAKAAAAQVKRNNSMIIGLLGVVILLVSGWLVWRRLNRIKNEAQE